jgi:ATP-binding cassette, subfamily B, bacterial
MKAVTEPELPGPRTSSRPVRETVAEIAALHGSIAGPIVQIAVVGSVAGVAEAGALMAFVQAVVAITTNDTGDPTIAGLTIGYSPGALLIIAGVLTSLAALLHVVLARGSVRVGEVVALNSRARLIDGFLGAQWGYVARYRMGRLQESMSLISANASLAATHLVVGLSSLVIIVVLFAAALVASPVITLSLMAVPFALFVVIRPQLRRLRHRSGQNVQGSMGLSEATAATANLILEYRTTGTQRPRAEQLKAISADHAARVATNRSALFTMAFLFKDSALIALIAVVGGLYLVTDLRNAAVTTAILLVIRMLGYLQQALRLVQDGTEDSATVFALRDSIEELEAHQERDGDLTVEAIEIISLDDVHYSYEADRIALEGVTLDIAHRTTVGVVGPSGAGKSTIAELLLGLRPPDSGTISVNGVPLSDLRRMNWTRLTSLVPQDQQLAEVSVAENIRFLRDWIDDESVRDAARRAHVHDEIMALPDGYDHVLGSRNQGLSGGQRQRIAIARALAGQPQLLLLDEPTSALDASTEQLFRQTLDELHGQITIVIIAHRPATLQACDTVVHLRDGRIERIEDGPRRAIAAS